MIKNYTAILLCLFLFLFASINVSAQVDRFAPLKYEDGKGGVLNYQMLFPDANPSRKYPLVIFLHGAGERGDDNKAQLKWGVQNFATDEYMSKYPAIVIAPQCPKDMQWSNLDFDRDAGTIFLKDAPSKPMELLIQLIEKTMKEMSVDPSRVYITGLSMGGFGTFDLTMRKPDWFAASVPVCGGGDISKAATIAHIPTWIFHGAEDAVVPSRLSADMLQALKDAGAHPGYTEYPEVGHFSWLMAYSDPLMIEWMFRQRKK